FTKLSGASSNLKKLFDLAAKTHSTRSIRLGRKNTQSRTHPRRFVGAQGDVYENEARENKSSMAASGMVGCAYNYCYSLLAPRLRRKRRWLHRRRIHGDWSRSPDWRHHQHNDSSGKFDCAFSRARSVH